MLYHAGAIVVGLTSLSRAPIIGGTMANRGKGKNKMMAIAIKTTAAVWECSICHRQMPLTDMDKPPVRCSNRKSCGRMFRNGKV